MLADRRILLPLVAVFVGACEGSTTVGTTLAYDAALSGANEHPPVETNGTGTFVATLSPTNVFSYTINFAGLSSASTMAHIHGPATVTQDAGILIDFNSVPSTIGNGQITLGGTAGQGQGNIDLKSAVIIPGVSGDSVRKLLDAGLLYVNVHTSNHGGGEVRGQIVRQVQD